MESKEKSLRTVLLGNAAFSFVSGLSLLLFSDSISKGMGITYPVVLPVIGGGLLFFAATVLYISTRKILSGKQVRSIVLQDWAWVIASALLLVLQPFEITTIGNLIIAAVALIVMSFALIQWRLLKKI